MRILFGVTVVLTALAAIQCGVKQSPADPMSLVETEMAFAGFTAENGVRDGFIMYAADDAIMFAPGPVNVKEYYAAQESNPALLTWEPKFAEISAAGDLGYTTGPWEFRGFPDVVIPDVSGEYVTLWKLQPDSSYRFIIDVGVAHGPHDTTVRELTLREPETVDSYDNLDLNRLKEDLAQIELGFSDEAAEDGAASAYATRIDETTRMYRPRSTPIIGVAPITGYLSEIEGTWTWTPLLTGVSQSGDLGYTYGVTRQAIDENTSEYSFVRIWRRDETGHWLLAVDVQVARPSSTAAEEGAEG